MDVLHFHLDANAVNARQADSALNELERLAELGAVDLSYSETTYGEAGYGSAMRADKAAEYTWAGLGGNADIEQAWRTSIEKAVFPAGVRSQSKRNDVEALLTAKIAGAVFVTRDGASRAQSRGILGSKSALAELGIEVVTPEEAVERAKART